MNSSLHNMIHKQHFVLKHPTNIALFKNFFIQQEKLSDFPKKKYNQKKTKKPVVLSKT